MVTSVDEMDTTENYIAGTDTLTTHWLVQKKQFYQNYILVELSGYSCQ